MSAVPVPDDRFRLADAEVRALAAAYGTPLYVIDEQALRSRIRRYHAAAAAAWPRYELTYASKANSCLAVLAIAAEEGCFIDVASEGELRAALMAGVPASRCHLHGNNKLKSELEFAVASGVREVVADHLGELETLAQIGVGRADEGPKVLLRLAPGVDPATHAKISTGQADSKFGFAMATGDAERALVRSLELGLPVAGVHAHVGSQLLDPEAQRAAGEVLARFLVAMRDRHGWTAEILNVGGGLGVRYGADDRPWPVEDYCRLVAEAVRSVLHGTGIDPVLVQEPGRSLVAEAGVTLYEVGVVKQAPRADGVGLRTYVAVDGGLSDNPRPALYGSRYEVGFVAADGRDLGPDRPVTVAGRHCETDTLFPDVAAPEGLAPGDWAQVLCTGAYNTSMASNYNRFPRPAAVLRRIGGGVAVMQTRETWEQVLARDVAPASSAAPDDPAAGAAAR